MKKDDIRPGRIYSWVYESDKPGLTLKGGRENANPLYARVSVRKVFAGQAASAETWIKLQKELNPNWIPSERAPLHVATENPCVVLSVTTGQEQVRIINFRTTSREWYVDGIPATSIQIDTINRYQPKHSTNGNYVPVMFPYVGNLSNVD